ncbi:MAG: hypothetical protein ACLQG3_01655 [Terracidiphilus sp.]
MGTIRTFANRHGLKIEPRPKEGRERVAKRLALQIAALPDAKLSQIITDLSGGVSRQTQGWIDVIKGSRR